MQKEDYAYVDCTVVDIVGMVYGKPGLFIICINNNNHRQKFKVNEARGVRVTNKIGGNRQ